MPVAIRKLMGTDEIVAGTKYSVEPVYVIILKENNEQIYDETVFRPIVSQHGNKKESPNCISYIVKDSKIYGSFLSFPWFD